MKQPIAYEDAVDLLDADHIAVKKMFIDYSALCEDRATADHKRALAERICRALTVHTQLEEDLFYPEVRKVIGADCLMDEALDEHAQAKNVIARIRAMKTVDAAYDATVAELAALIDRHVLEEREQMFLKTRQAPLDLRRLAPPLLKRKRKLTQKATLPTSKETP